MTGSPTCLEVAASVARSARRRPVAVAVRDCGAGRDLTWAQLHDGASRLAARLRAELPAGGVVMLVASNRCEFFVALLGGLAGGMAVFPVHPRLSDAELRAAARRSGARAVIGAPRAPAALARAGLAIVALDDLLDAPCAVDADRLDHTTAALLLQSSGTTGRPKIVRRPSPAVDAVARNVVEAVGLGPPDRVLAAIPFCHAYGVENAVLAPMLAGSRVDAHDGFDPATVVEALQEGGATVFPGVPFMFQFIAGLLARRPDRPCRAYSAGGPLPTAVARAFQHATGTAIGQLYGATEIGSVTFGDPDDPDFDPGSVGRPLRDVEIRIVTADRQDPQRPLPPGAEGEVAVRAPSMLDGYVDDVAPVGAGGFFLTGDIGRLDARGNLHVTGRLKLQIDVGGLKVNPLEVEEVLAAHPDVRECVVVPVPLTDTVNRLKAVVVPQTTGAEVDAARLREFSRKRLAPYKVPRIIEVREALPRSATGKVRRDALLEP